MPEQHRKSIFRKYYMIPEKSMPVLADLANARPAACKVLLYFFHHMDKANLVSGVTHRDIRDAFTFQLRDENGVLKNRSLTSATITGAVKHLQEVQIIDVDYERYFLEQDESKSNDPGFQKFKKSLSPVVTHAYVVNPDLVWAAYQVERSFCRFPKDNPKFAGKSWENLSAYYMFNKNYENDFYWMSQRNMKSIAVFFYLVCRMNTRNEVNPERGGGIEKIAKHIGVSRQTVSAALKLLREHNFIYRETLGRSYRFILNPDIVWASNPAALKQCRFPKNLSVKTPCRRQRAGKTRDSVPNHTNTETTFPPADTYSLSESLTIDFIGSERLQNPYSPTFCGMIS